MLRNCLAAGCCVLASLLPIAAQNQEPAVTFKSNSNLVPVTVVVRDSKGHPVGNLGIENFQIFDNGKPQLISRFTVEQLRSGNDATSTAPKEKPADGQTLAEANTTGIPDRFVSYLFDDLHMNISDLHYTRDAAKRQIANLSPLERVAIYTTSGRHMTDFTADRDKLGQALDALRTGQATASAAMRDLACPPMTFYMADRIYNHSDMQAFGLAMSDAAACAPSGSSAAFLRQQVMTAAREEFFQGDRESLWALDALRTAVARTASMPGQRTLVLISPGFLVTSDRLNEETDLIDRAIQSGIVINALDSRGVYTMDVLTDASKRTPPDPSTISAKIGFRTTEMIQQGQTMDTLAAGTGGVFYKGSNDMNDGIARTAGVPEFIYILGFNPLDVKADGRYHNLKIELRGVKGLELQARRGYFAPLTTPNPEEQAQNEIREAFFSNSTVHNLPAVLQTQYFKTENGDATLSAVAKIDVKQLAFHKEGDRNRNDVTVLTGLFDGNGNYVTGKRAAMQLRLLDDTLATRVGSGISLRSSFTVHPGSYVVRMVVRDTEGQLMSAQSSLVEIP